MINYDPRNSFHRRLQDMNENDWRFALSLLRKGEPVFVGGRKMPQREFIEMMKMKVMEK